MSTVHKTCRQVYVKTYIGFRKFVLFDIKLNKTIIYSLQPKNSSKNFYSDVF